MEILKSMCAVHAPAGNEVEMKEFILNYLKSNESSFTVKPEVISGNEIQDCIILKFGKPRTAIFAHMDSIGFTVRYGKQLIKLGGPRTNEGTELIGTDSNEIVMSCGSSVSASTLALAYSLINDEYTAKIYIGSWTEFGKK